MPASRLPLAVAFSLLVLATACERADPRLKTLAVGISKDSALKLMQVSKPKRLDPYLIKGQYIETMYLAKPSDERKDSLRDRAMSPMVLINGKLTGWGWPYWDSVAAANKIEVSGKK